MTIDKERIAAIRKRNMTPAGPFRVSVNDIEFLLDSIASLERETLRQQVLLLNFVDAADIGASWCDGCKAAEKVVALCGEAEISAARKHRVQEELRKSAELMAEDVELNSALESWKW